jgi:hypothetical protein
MKTPILAIPAVILLAATASAQTDTTTGVATGTDAATTTEAAIGSEGTFGSNWSLSVRTMFFTGDDNATLRTSDEITSAWQSLPQEDRDLILADCRTFLAAHGDDTADAATGATSGDVAAGATTESAASADAGTTAADTTVGTEAGTGIDAGADVATTGAMSTNGTTTTTTPVGYDMAEMQAICAAVDKL